MLTLLLPWLFIVPLGLLWIDLFFNAPIVTMIFTLVRVIALVILFMANREGIFIIHLPPPVSLTTPLLTHGLTSASMLTLVLFHLHIMRRALPAFRIYVAMWNQFDAQYSYILAVIDEPIAPFSSAQAHVISTDDFAVND
ncbi:hypothetical protein C1H46_032175 [Malus baccata]|uniref:Uncharacterized protein n=1 Tax=Malus baccata TaxID=106549 RepID=A0A540L712_MALBA|nr:hypothetical protein C1H46_032175 [Malus baccata]